MDRNMKRHFIDRLLALCLVLALLASALPVQALSVQAASAEEFVIQVMDESDNPVKDASVRVGEQELPLTDLNGQTIATGLAQQAAFHCVVEKTGYQKAEADLTNAEPWTAEITLVKLPAVTVTGLVTNEKGQPVAKAAVQVSGYAEYSATTGEDGRFQIAGVYTGGGAYELSVVAEGYQQARQPLKLAGENTVTLKEKDNQALTFAMPALQIRYGSTGTNAASGADRYTSSNPAVATVDNDGTVHPTGIGTATITAIRDETATTARAEASYVLTVVKGVQAELNWVNSIPEQLSWRDPYANTVTGGSGDGAVTYASSNPTVAEVDENGVLTIHKTGEVTITAKKSGGELYEDQTASYTLHISKDVQAPLSFEQAYPDAIFYGDAFANPAKGGSVPENAITYSSSDETVATVDTAGVLTTLRAGTVEITATLKGNDRYEDISASYTLTIYRANQKATFLFVKGSDTKTITYGDSFENPASGGENAPITYKSSVPAVATVDAQGVVTTHRAGQTLITANNPADDRYNERNIAYTLIVQKADQTVTFAQDPAQVPALVYGEEFTNPATAKTPITYASSDSTVATVNSDGSLTLHKAGTVTITATAQEDDCYNAASASYTLQISKAKQTVTFEQGKTPAVTFNQNNNQFVNAASTNAIASGQADILVTCSVASGEELVKDLNVQTGAFTICGAGVITLQVDFSGNDCYEPVSDSYVLTVAPAEQTISFPKDSYSVIAGVDFAAPAAEETGEYFGIGTISYQIQEDNNHIIDSIDPLTGAIVLTNETGSAVIRAVKAADRNYKEASATYTLSVRSEEFNEAHYVLNGPRKNRSGWFTGSVSLEAEEGYLLSYKASSIGGANWLSVLGSAASEEGTTSVRFFVRDVLTGRISRPYTESIKIDTVAPSVEIHSEAVSGWDKLLEIISFGLLGKDSIDFTVECSDATSGIATVDYYISEGTTVPMSYEELEALDPSVWKAYPDGQGFSVSGDQVFVAYARATDTAGNYTYASTNGIILDTSKPQITVDVRTEANEYGFHQSDVELAISVDASCAGLRSVSYRVERDNGLVTTVPETSLFSFEGGENPAYTDLKQSWSTEENGKNVIISAMANVSDDVRVYITAVDNAGNKATYVTGALDYLPLKINAVSPTLQVSFVDDPTPKASYQGVSYYDAARTAKVEITGMTAAFDPKQVALEIVAMGGNTAEAQTFEVTGWEHTEPTDEAIQKGEKTKADAVHTAYVKFGGSANYTFAARYTDLSGKQAMPYQAESFAIDLDQPTGEITIGTNKWSSLVQTLSFQLWRNVSVDVTAECKDATSPIQSVQYYKTDRTSAMLQTELEALEPAQWKPFDGLTIYPDEWFTIYLKITDYAGHTAYISSDGHIIEQTDSTITLTSAQPNTQGYYKDDVEVQISVAEPKPYSGIQRIEYQLTDHKEAESENWNLLYQFDYQSGILAVTDWDGTQNVTEKQEIAALTHEYLASSWSGSITVDTEKYNSADVRLYVRVTDNAGNVTTYDQDGLGYLPLKINSTAPQILVQYDQNDPATVLDERGYFGQTRTAIITVTDRADTFCADQLKLAVTANGKALSDQTLAAMTDSWSWDMGADADTHILKVHFTEDANYEFTMAYTNKADMTCGVQELVPDADSFVTYAEGTAAPRFFTVDQTAPTADVAIDDATWSTLLETLTFHLWKNTDAMVTAKAADETSPIKSIEYALHTGTAAAALDSLTWNSYDEPIRVSCDKRFTVYLKVTDCAGKVGYFSSDGYIAEQTPAAISVTTPNAANKNGYYRSNVQVNIDVNEQADETYSGIQKIEYWVTSSDHGEQAKRTQQGVLYEEVYQGQANGATGSLTVTNWPDPTKNQTVTQYPSVAMTHDRLLRQWHGWVNIDCTLNNSDDVRVYVRVTDHAGNVTTTMQDGKDYLPLKINATPPQIAVSFDQNAVVRQAGARGYFNVQRTATITVKDRTSTFKPENVKLTVTAVDAKGKQLPVDLGAMTQNWTWQTQEPTAQELASGEKTSNDAIHTLKVAFTNDANYEFTMSYTNAADLRCAVREDEGKADSFVTYTEETAAPRYFTVDQTKPTGTITAKGIGTWNKLIEVLSFGLWSKTSVELTGTSNDVTSPIDSVCYYKTSSTTKLTVDDLEKISAWMPLTKLTVPADERLTVYVRIIDYAGNTTYISTDGIILDSTAPAVEKIEPKVTVTPTQQPVNGIYRADVPVKVVVEDPIVGAGNSYSGLKEIRYEVLNMGTVTQSGTLFTFSQTAHSQSDLQHLWQNDRAIVVDRNRNNSNDVQIKVYATDNAGNRGEGSTKIKIDTTAPSITVSYDNNDADTAFAGGVTDGYFRSGRTATITVTERNFDPAQIRIQLTNSDGAVPVLSGWRTVEGTGNKDNTTHTATLTYTADGDYQFSVTGADLAGNAADATVYMGTAPQRFTIDQTLPVISVSYDVGEDDAQNGSYFNTRRTATITIREHNFETSRITLNVSADGAAAPAVSGWTDSGDTHTATVTYSADAHYSFDIAYRDKAGNTAAAYPTDRFYIDQTAPQLKISGIADKSAHNGKGNIGFTVIATDANFDVFTPTLTAVVRENGELITRTLDAGQLKEISGGQEWVVTNLDADGIYKFTCTVVDKAGNAYQQVTLVQPDQTERVVKCTSADTLLTFSVNREGSTYDLTPYTAGLSAKGYVQKVTEDVAVTEINVNRLQKYTVTLNGKALQEGTDFTVSQPADSGETWNQYTYTIKRSLFEAEGEYTLVVSSQDQAENDAYSDVKGASIRFVVDRTAPMVTASGLKSNARYQTERQTVTLMPSDDGGALKSLTVLLVDDHGDTLKELVNLQGEALEKALEAGEGKITFELEEGLYQNVRIICDDLAECGVEDNILYDKTFTDVSVSSSSLMIFWANRPLRWGILGGAGGLAILLLLLLLLRRRNKKNIAN